MLSTIKNTNLVDLKIMHYAYTVVHYYILYIIRSNNILTWLFFVLKIYDCRPRAKNSKKAI